MPERRSEEEEETADGELLHHRWRSEFHKQGGGVVRRCGGVMFRLTTGARVLRQGSLHDSQGSLHGYILSYMRAFDDTAFHSSGASFATFLSAKIQNFK